MYALTLGLREAVDPAKVWRFSDFMLRQRIHDTLPWFGAMFAACYALFYARFASQWSYLATLYNQIKAAEITAAAHERRDVADHLAEWKAGFVEDADDLHLSTKPTFASVITSWLKDPAVEKAFHDSAIGGKSRLDQLRTATNKYSTSWAKELGVTSSERLRT